MAVVATPVIDYSGSFHLQLPPSGVWATIEHIDRLQRWWPWLHDLRVEGTGLQPGVLLHGVVDPPVPYCMRVDVELVSCTAPWAIDAAVHGDLRGPAHLRLRPEGSGTRAEVAWSVEMMQPAMRLASRVAHPLLQWGHDRVVESTLRGFRRQVEQAWREQSPPASGGEPRDAAPDGRRGAG